MLGAGWGKSTPNLPHTCSMMDLGNPMMPNPPSDKHGLGRVTGWVKFDLGLSPVLSDVEEIINILMEKAFL